MASVLCSFIFFSSVIGSAAGEDSDGRFAPISEPFLGRVVASRSEVKEVVEETLRSRFRADTEERLASLQAEMSATFEALPKTEFGLVSGSAAHYLLHRHFLRSRAWLVKGLAPDGKLWNASSLLEPLRSYGVVAELFEQRLESRGLNLGEIALLAAMIENQVHQTAVGRLRKVWLALKRPKATTLTEADALKALQAYVASYMVNIMDTSNLDEVFTEVERKYPIWSKTVSFLEQTVRLFAPRGREVSFADIERMVVEISEHYGSFQAEDCHGIKVALLDVEGSQPGRVPLPDFYRAKLGGVWQFSESVSYMRHVGILEESGGQSPSVLISNYLSSPSQQIAASDEYAVTCLDECESILGFVETHVKAPVASPVQLISLVQGLSTESTPASFLGLPADLVGYLERIANIHSGMVPLHSRLFAQWLHHAFPRECNYPHAAGRTRPLSPGEFENLTSLSSYARKAEIRAFAEEDRRRISLKSVGEALPWDDTEELVALHMTRREVTKFDAFVPKMDFAVVLSVLLLLLPNLAMCQALLQLISKACRRGSSSLDKLVIPQI